MRSICLLVCALSSAVVQGSLFVLSESQGQKSISEIDNIWPYRHEVFEFHPEHKDLSTGLVRPLCVLHSLGEGVDDSYNFEKAVHQCGRGGIVRLPDAN